MTKVLFTHQATVPAYRIDLFNMLHELSSGKIEFFFINSAKVSRRENLGSIYNYRFHIIPVKTAYLSYFKIQTWVFQIKKYDCIVFENCFNNLTNLLAFPLCKILGKKTVLIGHYKDNTRHNDHWINRIKSSFYKYFDGVLAYTEKEADFFRKKNKNVLPFNNTINVSQNREALIDNFKHRDIYREKLGIKPEAIALLYVGRIDSRKGFDESLVSKIIEIENINFLVVGGKLPISYEEVIEFDHSNDINLLSELFIASDLYMHPGDVGLGPITAVSFGLKPLFFKKRNHNPEEYYLQDINSARVDSVQEFIDLIKNGEHSDSLGKRISISNSIRFLSLENSAAQIIKLIRNAID